MAKTETQHFIDVHKIHDLKEVMIQTLFCGDGDSLFLTDVFDVLYVLFLKS